jgi:hypothetical protein
MSIASHLTGIAILFFNQDILVLCAFIVLLTLLSFSSFTQKFSNTIKTFWDHPKISVLILTLLLLVGLLSCHAFFPIYGFDFSRDEVMALFDEKIIASGKLLAAIPAEWRDFTDSLNPTFILVSADHVFWHSEYLPINSALMALTGVIFDPRMMQPLFAVISLLTLFSVARRLFAPRTDVITVILIVYACSPQFLITGLTSYAMTAHLTFNLVWLWLFLRDDRLSHFCAVLIGFLATGLHQLIFHPLFVAPFLLLLLKKRRFALMAFYMATYTFILLFWMNYWNFITETHNVSTQFTSSLAYWLARFEAAVKLPGAADLSAMIANLVRLVTWQHVLVLPLAAFGLLREGRRYDIPQALALGIVLSLLSAVILMPSQGHGWGYRYLHGFLGNLALLAGYGWIAATKEPINSVRRHLQAVFVASSIVGALIFVPLHALQAGALVAPYRAAYRLIEKTNADFVIVDSVNIFYGRDLVRNNPMLTNKPLIFALAQLQVRQIDDLCMRGSVALFEREAAVKNGIEVYGLMTEEVKRQVEPVRERLLLTCGKPIQP